jgi:hypothetical protein
MFGSWLKQPNFPSVRGTDTPKTKMSRLDEKIDALDEETRRMKAARRRIERDQKAGLNKKG